MKNWRKDSESEAKIVGVLVGATISGSILAAKAVNNMAAKLAHAHQLKRCAIRDLLAEKTMKDLLTILPKW